MSDTGGFSPYDYRKDSFRRWVDKVDQELLMLHLDMQKVAALVNSKKGTDNSAISSITGGAVGGGSGRLSGGVSVRPLSSFPVTEGQQSFDAEGNLTPTIDMIQSGETGAQETSIPNTEMLVQATYAIRTASNAMRGYLMLLDQAGLSKDQKKLIMEVENSLMAIMKLAQAVRILQGIMKLGSLSSPEGIFDLILMGGFASSSVAYGSKVQGGGI